MIFGPPLQAPGRVYPGSTAQIYGTFQDDDGVAFNPTTVVFLLISPCGASASYTYGTDAEVTRPATGSYLFTGSLTEPGAWSYQWRVTTSSVISIQEGRITVQATPFFESTRTAYA